MNSVQPTVFNPAQLYLLGVFSHIKSDEELNDIKQLVADYYVNGSTISSWLRTVCLSGTGMRSEVLPVSASILTRDSMSWAVASALMSNLSFSYAKITN